MSRLQSRQPIDLPQKLGSPTRARTWDLRINSPSLYRLSYQGIDVAPLLRVARTKTGILAVFDRVGQTRMRGELTGDRLSNRRDTGVAIDADQLRQIQHLRLHGFLVAQVGR